MLVVLLTGGNAWGAAAWGAIELSGLNLTDCGYPEQLIIFDKAPKFSQKTSTVP